MPSCALSLQRAVYLYHERGAPPVPPGMLRCSSAHASCSNDVRPPTERSVYELRISPCSARDRCFCASRTTAALAASPAACGRMKNGFYQSD